MTDTAADQLIEVIDDGRPFTITTGPARFMLLLFLLTAGLAVWNLLQAAYIPAGVLAAFSLYHLLWFDRNVRVVTTPYEPDEAIRSIEHVIGGPER